MVVPQNVINQIHRVEFSLFEPLSTTTLWAYPVGQSYDYRIFLAGQWVSVADGASGSLEELIQRAELAIKAAVAATEGAENVNATLVNNVLTITDREGNSTSIDLSGQGGGSVNSVNGKTGNVVLSAEDVNALPSNTPLFSGDYNDLANKPTIPAEQVQSDWNQTNNSSKDFIKNKPTIPTVPTNVSAFTNDAGYLTQHQDISGKADKSEMSVVDGTGTDADKTTITLKTGTSATVLKSHQDISGKQDTLVSGTNIKTINNQSILGSGNITIQGGGSSVQSDWNQTDTEADDYIKNKPTIPTIIFRTWTTT